MTMKTPSPRMTSMPQTKRGFGQIILVLLFLLSAFHLAHLPMMASHGVIDMWRALAMGSLFLFFCVPSSGHPHSRI